MFSELLGTFFLVLDAAGGGMLGQAFPNTIIVARRDRTGAASMEVERWLE